MIAYAVWPHSDRLFGHVFLAVPIGNGLVVEIDGQYGVPVLKFIDCGEDQHPGEWYAARGWCVVQCPLPDNTHSNPRPVMLATCVGMVKRLLNVNAFWVLTPAQLYRHLKRKFHG